MSSHLHTVEIPAAKPAAGTPPARPAFFESGVLETARLIKANWEKNYRHHGGAAAVGRCTLGHWWLARRRAANAAASPADCLTCSVIPQLSGLWARLMHRAIPGSPNIWVADCSGGFRPAHALGAPIRIRPMINYQHGVKVDLLMYQACSAPFTIVSDDDVFWLNPTPWEWAREAFAADPRLAVVSFVPRERFQWDIDGLDHEPMGSYCLIIRRDLWIREGLSLRGVPKPAPSRNKSYRGFYDTGDFANVELIKRGYRVAIAPQEIRRNFVVYKNISTALLQVQKGARDFTDFTYRDSSALAKAFLLARELESLASQLGGQPLVDPHLLDRAEKIIYPLTAPSTLEEMRADVRASVERLRSAAA